jgi:glycosyltransferase involved in cell wall biosynthesis
MENCKISVALASYNGANYLKEQLESVYAQSLLPDEVIVCDDCSTDNSIEILNEYKEKYCLTYFINEKNLGFVKNFEKAISLCSGDYIALSDQDDVWFPQKIEFLYNEMITCEIKNPDQPIIVHHDVYIVDENLKNNGIRFLKKKGKVAGLRDLLFGNSKVQGASSLFNRKLKELCFPLPDNVPLHDLYMSYVCACFGIRKLICEPLMLYRQHANNQIGVDSFSIYRRVSKFLNKETILANENEKQTLSIFYNQFRKKLSEANRDEITDYFEILGNEISIGSKVGKVLRNRFNSDGSILKLILKILNNGSIRIRVI